VAMKTLQPRYADNPAAARNFVREVKTTARLPHPGIPPVHEVGTLPDGRPYMVMKLIRGRTLAELLAEQGPGPVQWLDEVEAVAHAVGYAHSRGVIHRDLKPQNVMVGAFGEVQVMDWGLAKTLGEAEPEAAGAGGPAGDDCTVTGTTKGTPAYMSPEQARGDVRQVTERSDVFSLGAMLLTLLTGRPPYTADTPRGVVLQAAAGDLADAHRRLSLCGADRAVIALCRRCLSADPADRPANAEVVAAEVARIRRTLELSAHTRWVRRWQGALAGVMLVVFATVGVVWWGNSRAESERVAALARTRAEVDRGLDGVERKLADGRLNEAVFAFAEAYGLAALDPDPKSASRVRLERVRRDCRTAFDLSEYQTLYDQRGDVLIMAPDGGLKLAKPQPEWRAFEGSFTRVGIGLDLEHPNQTAEQINRHPFAGVFRRVLVNQAARDVDRGRGQKLAAVAALVNDQHFSAFARQAEGGTKAGGAFHPSMFGD